MAKEWQELDDAEKTQRESLLTLVKEIVPYNMAHNAEHEACDLLMEIEQVDMLEKDIDENAYAKVCLYLTRCVSARGTAPGLPSLPSTPLVSVRLLSGQHRALGTLLVSVSFLSTEQPASYRPGNYSRSPLAWCLSVPDCLLSGHTPFCLLADHISFG